MMLHEFVPLKGSSDESPHRQRRQLRLGFLLCGLFNAGVVVMLWEVRPGCLSRPSFLYEAVTAQALVARKGVQQLGFFTRFRTGSHHGQISGRNPIPRASWRPRFEDHQPGMQPRGGLRAIAEKVASAEEEKLKHEDSTFLRTHLSAPPRHSNPLSLMGHPLDLCAPLVGQDFCSGDTEVCVGYLAAYRKNREFDRDAAGCVGAWDWANAVLRDPNTAEGQWLLCGSTTDKVRDFFKAGSIQGHRGLNRMYFPQHFAALAKIDELCGPAKQDLS